MSKRAGNGGWTAGPTGAPAAGTAGSATAPAAPPPARGPTLTQLREWRETIDLRKAKRLEDLEAGKLIDAEQTRLEWTRLLSEFRKALLSLPAKGVAESRRSLAGKNALTEVQAAEIRKTFTALLEAQMETLREWSPKDDSAGSGRGES